MYSADGKYEVTYKPNVVLFYTGDVLFLCRHVTTPNDDVVSSRVFQIYIMTV